jgi:hypothetical protein
VSRWLLLGALLLWLGLLLSPRPPSRQFVGRENPPAKSQLGPLPPFPLEVEQLKPLTAVKRLPFKAGATAATPAPGHGGPKPKPPAIPQPPEDLARPPTGAEALGGTLNLESLNEPAMPPAALVERARWQANGDPLSPLPAAWRGAFRKALGATAVAGALAPAMQWRQPVAGLCKEEAIPLLLQPGAAPQVLQAARSELARQALANFLMNHPQPPQGQRQPLLLHLDPLGQSQRC